MRRLLVRLRDWWYAWRCWVCSDVDGDESLTWRWGRRPPAPQPPLTAYTHVRVSFDREAGTVTCDVSMSGVLWRRVYEVRVSDAPVVHLYARFNQHQPESTYFRILDPASPGAPYVVGED